MADLRIDPMANLDASVRLARAAERLAALLDPSLTGSVLPGPVRRQLDDLIEALRRDGTVLGELAAALRRDARGASAADETAAGRITAITRCLG